VRLAVKVTITYPKVGQLQHHLKPCIRAHLALLHEALGVLVMQKQAVVQI
jgi:hypothetical protein